MAKSTAIRKTLYLDIKDTIEEVGISRRQLGHWQDQGLVAPELGADAKRYTEGDIALLKLLKRLIVDQRFPIPFVKQLVQAEALGRGENAPHAARFLDLDRGELVSRGLLAEQLWNEFGATADEEQVEARFYQLALLLFRLVRLRHRTATSYHGRRDEILKFVRGMDFVARIERQSRQEHDSTLTREHGYVLDPGLDGESWSPGELRDLLASTHQRLATFQAAAEGLVARGELSARHLQRFWDRQTIKALQAPVEPLDPDITHEEISWELDELHANRPQDVPPGR